MSASEGGRQDRSLTGRDFWRWFDRSSSKLFAYALTQEQTGLGMYIQSKCLFEERPDTSDPAWIIKRYFDEVYDSGHFVHVISLLAKRWGYITDDVACHFPDHDSFFEEDRFEGVQFTVALPLPQPDEVVVSDAEFVAWLQEACRRYLVKHPSDQAAIAEALGQLAAGFKSEH